MWSLLYDDVYGVYVWGGHAYHGTCIELTENL